ncbi:MAG: hypothetical protein M3280_10095 [Actinomycetota bacterium]|nr:hypothetical protein [Actinomycetota bacterium]
MTRTSYLRVYLPIDSFPEEDRSNWLAKAEESSGHGSLLERRWLAPSTLSRTGVWEAEGCYVRRIEGAVFVCPWRTRLRMLAGLLAFRSSVPEEVAEAFVPQAEAERAARELATLGEGSPHIRSHIVHANWHVPLRWFAAFDPSERILVEDTEGLRLRYETTLDRASRRLDRSVAILDAAPIDESVTQAVRELAAWVTEFQAEGLLELDYAGVAGAFSHEELLDDHSAADVWVCLEALESGDLPRAAGIFEELSERWGAARSLEVVN